MKKRRKLVAKNRGFTIRRILLLLGILLLLVASIYGITRLVGKQDTLGDLVLMPFSAMDQYAYTGSGFYYIDEDASALKYYDIANPESESTLSLGSSEVQIAANGSLAVIYNSAAVHIVGQSTPIDDAGQVQRVKCGAQHIAVTRLINGAESLHIYDNNGIAVDVINMGSSTMLLDYGFGTDNGTESLWTLVMDTSASEPVSTITIYSYTASGPSMTGIITVQSQLAEEIVFSPSSIFVLGTNQLIRYDRAVSTESYRLLIYGYKYEDYSAGASKPLFLLTPRISAEESTTASPYYQSVKLYSVAEADLASETVASLQLPDEIHSVFVIGGKLFAFSEDTLYTYTAAGTLESTRALPANHITSATKLSETRFLLQRGSEMYLSTP